MRRLVVSLAMAAVLACGFATAASAAPPRTEAEASQQIAAWVRVISTWTQAYDAVAYEQAELLGALNEGIGTARGHFDSGSPDEGRAWAAAWAPQQRARLVTLKQRLAALSPTPPGLVGPGYDLRFAAAEVRPVMDMMARTPALTAEQIDSTEILSLQVIDVIERSAGGDRMAADYLSAAFFEINIAMMRSEIRVFETYLPLLEREESPKGSIMKTSIAIDEGLIATMSILLANDRGRAIDRPATAAAIRAQAARIDAAVAELPPRIRGIREEGLTGALARIVESEARSYEASRPVMADLAGRLRTIAGAIEGGASLDLDSVLNAIDAMAPVIDQFARMDTERQALLAQ